MTPPPQISVIIPLSDHTDIPDIVRALSRQDVERDLFETIAVDATGDAEVGRRVGMIDAAEADACRLQTVTLPAAGRGTALNEGVRRAAGSLYLFLGDDFIPGPDWIRTHLEFHETELATEAVGMGPAVFPEHLRRDRFTQWLDETGTAFGAPFYSEDPDAVSPVWFYGANTSIKRPLLWRAGLFDDDFPYDALEDFEFGRRLFRLGMRVVYLPEAVAIHEHTVSLSERRRQFVRVGESAALVDAKYSAGGMSRRSFLRQRLAQTWNEWYWWAASAVTRRDEHRHNYWNAALDAAYHRGYAQQWRRMVRTGRPQRRLSAAFPDWMERALDAGVVAWQATAGRTAGLYPFDNEDSQLRPEQRDGRDCLSVWNPDGAAWAYFRVEPIFSQYLTQSIELVCCLHLPQAAEVWVEYDSTDPDVQIVPDRPGAFKATAPVEIDAGRQTCRFQLPDFCCQERINGGDFRIVCGLEPNVPFALESAQVIRTAAEDDHSLRPFDWLEGMGFTPEREPRVSIVIPVHNHLLYTLQCLQSIAIHASRTSYEVIVVDDASTDETRSILSRIPGLQVVELDTNVGFTAACNRGAEAARGELLLFLNNDIVALPGWLDELVQAFDDAADAGVVGSRLIYPQTGTIQHLGIAFDGESRPYHLERDGGTIEGRPEDTRHVPAVTGACFLTPRRLFAELQGFDPAYEGECQDIDFCLKAAERGFASYCCGRSVLLHYESVTRKELRWEPGRDVGLFRQRWNDFLQSDRGALRAA